jgi:hypothetical protein
MPLETQALYFHLLRKADDDGVVEAYSIIKTLGITGDSLQILIAKNFIYPLNQEAVLYVINWLEHNKIRPDHLVKSIYRPLLKAALPNLELVEPRARSDVKDNSRRLMDSPRTVHGLPKLSQDKLNIGTNVPLNANAPRKSGDISVLLEKTSRELKERGVI